MVLNGGRIPIAPLEISVEDSVWIIYVLAIAKSSVSRFFQPAVSAAVPMIAPRDKLAQVNAALGVSYAVSQLGGPALGGTLVEMMKTAGGLPLCSKRQWGRR